jgi:hypothetical protein
MFAIERKSFGFIAPKTWVTLADDRYQAYVLTHVLGAIKPKDLSLIEDIS